MHARHTPDGVEVRHRVPGFSDRWIIPEVPVPEAAWHDACLRLLFAVLAHWVERLEIDAVVYRDIAVRVSEANRRVGFDPDLCVLAPAPAQAAELESVRLWEHSPPVLAIEVVSPHHPYKDYVETPDKCAAAGVRELVVFDPKLAGPRVHGGPALLQVWQRAADGAFERVFAGSTPVRSGVLDAWLVVSDEGTRLRVADDPSGTALWPTAEEAARSAEQAARSAEQVALRRVAELELELARRKG